MDIIKHVLKSKEDYLASLDCWEFQVFLSKKIYEQAIQDENFFPPFKSSNSSLEMVKPQKWIYQL